MHKFKNSVIAFFGLLTLIGTFVDVVPHTGFGQGSEGNGGDRAQLRRATVRRGGARSCSLQ